MAVLLDAMKKENQPTLMDRVKRFWTLEFLSGSAMDIWLTGAFTKICVYVNSEQELKDVYQKAKDAGLLCSIIEDNGQTEFHGVPTFTAVAIGPHLPEQLDPITGKLPLL